jgi:hypothetical protein
MHSLIINEGKGATKSHEYEFVNEFGHDYIHVCPKGLVFHPFHGVIDFQKKRLASLIRPI